MPKKQSFWPVSSAPLPPFLFFNFLFRAIFTRLSKSFVSFNSTCHLHWLLDVCRTRYLSNWCQADMPPWVPQAYCIIPIESPLRISFGTDYKQFRAFIPGIEDDKILWNFQTNCAFSDMQNRVLRSRSKKRRKPWLRAQPILQKSK